MAAETRLLCQWIMQRRAREGHYTSKQFALYYEALERVQTWICLESFFEGFQGKLKQTTAQLLLIQQKIIILGKLRTLKNIIYNSARMNVNVSVNLRVRVGLRGLRVG